MTDEIEVGYKRPGHFSGGWDYPVGSWFEIIREGDVIKIETILPEVTERHRGYPKKGILHIPENAIWVEESRMSKRKVEALEKALTENIKKVTGKTYLVRDILKAHGFTFDPNMKSWVRK